MNLKHFLLKETYHIHDDMDKYSLILYNNIKNKNVGKYIFNDLPVSLKINKLIINITDKLKSKGQIDLDKSKKTKNGFIIYIDLRKDFTLDTLSHELDHALRFTLKKKVDILKKLNYLKSFNIFTQKIQSEIEQFIYCMYLVSDEEFESKVKQFHGEIKEQIILLNIEKINNRYFELIYNTSSVKNDIERLKNFKIKDCLHNISDNNINKFFCIYEDNKKELDRIENTKTNLFRKLKLIIKGLKQINSNNFELNIEDDKIYNPKKSPYYYERWINDQGIKLENKIKRLKIKYL